MPRTFLTDLTDTFFLLMNTPLIPPEEDKSKPRDVQLTDFTPRRREQQRVEKLDESMLADSLNGGAHHARRGSNDTTSSGFASNDSSINFAIGDVAEEADQFVNGGRSSISSDQS